jgi:hypothetical protein
MPAGTARDLENCCPTFASRLACFTCANAEWALATIRIPETAAANRGWEIRGAGYFIEFTF